MLTGDKAQVAKEVARQLGVDEVHAELLPGDKVQQVESLLKEKSGKGKLALWATESTMPRCFPELI